VATGDLIVSVQELDMDGEHFDGHTDLDIGILDYAILLVHLEWILGRQCFRYFNIGICEDLNILQRTWL
jgi:hypothetical protein